MGKSTLIRTLLGHVRAARRPHPRCSGRTRRARSRTRWRAWRGLRARRPRRVPQPERAREPGDGRAAGRDGRNDWTYERVLETFPRLAERWAPGRAAVGRRAADAVDRPRADDAPELIILDEATEGLAPLIVAEIWRVIGEIRASGIATLIVDRDYRRVLAHSDRALVLQKGRARDALRAFAGASPSAGTVLRRGSAIARGTRSGPSPAQARPQGTVLRRGSVKVVVLGLQVLGRFDEVGVLHDAVGRGTPACTGARPRRPRTRCSAAGLSGSRGRRPRSPRWGRRACRRRRRCSCR
jgi:branched-chain amino acid transport system ATP-binding protein